MMRKVDCLLVRYLIEAERLETIPVLVLITIQMSTYLIRRTYFMPFRHSTISMGRGQIKSS